MGGTPAVVFGPGNIAQAHARDEYIDISQLEEAYKIIGVFLKSMP
jgi:acetylornithine deacetylase